MDNILFATLLVSIANFISTILAAFRRSRCTDIQSNCCGGLCEFELIRKPIPADHDEPPSLDDE